MNQMRNLIFVLACLSFFLSTNSQAFKDSGYYQGKMRYRPSWDGELKEGYKCGRKIGTGYNVEPCSVHHGLWRRDWRDVTLPTELCKRTVWVRGKKTVWLNESEQVKCRERVKKWYRKFSGTYGWYREYVKENPFGIKRENFSKTGTNYVTFVEWKRALSWMLHKRYAHYSGKHCSTDDNTKSMCFCKDGKHSRSNRREDWLHPRCQWVVWYDWFPWRNHIFRVY